MICAYVIHKNVSNYTQSDELCILNKLTYSTNRSTRKFAVQTAVQLFIEDVFALQKVILVQTVTKISWRVSGFQLYYVCIHIWLGIVVTQCVCV